MDSDGPFSLSRSFERHLRAKNLSEGTVVSYLVGVRQFTAFLRPRGRGLEEATRADLEGFIADLMRLAGWKSGPCCRATGPRPPTLAPVTPTGACLPPTAYDQG